MRFNKGVLVVVRHGVGQELFAESVYKMKIPSTDPLGYNVCTLVKRKGALRGRDYNFVEGMDFSFTDHQLLQIGGGFAEWARTKGK